MAVFMEFFMVDPGNYLPCRPFNRFPRHKKTNSACQGQLEITTHTTKITHNKNSQETDVHAHASATLC